jgi:dolichol-phosphate mannosyltransferase
MDADFSHHPRFIPRLLEAMGQADIAIGSRFIPGAAVSGCRPWRTMLSWASNMLIRQVLGLKVRDCTSGFRCFRKEALASLELDRFICEGPSIVEEILYLSHRKGMKIREVPIVFYERSKGRSKLTLKKLFFVLRDILWIRIRYA